MSPFLGTTEEREALATYFFHELKRGSKESDAPLVLPPIQVQIPEFRQDNEYLILAWPEYSLNLICEYENSLYLSDSKNRIRSIVIKKGEKPEILTEGLDVYCQLMERKNPSGGPKYRMNLVKRDGTSFLNHPG